MDTRPPAVKRPLGERRGKLLLVATVVVVTLGGGAVYKQATGRTLHEYDSGPVRTNSDTNTSIQVAVGEVVTFGGIVLESFSSRPAVLESIRIDPPLPSGMSLVDVKVAGMNRGVGMVTDRGFPPPGMPQEVIRPLPGAVVPAREVDDRWGVEVLMAFKLTEPGQFGFHHALVDYRIGDKKHRLRVNDGFLMCAGPEYPRCDTEAFQKLDDD